MQNAAAVVMVVGAALVGCGHAEKPQGASAERTSGSGSGVVIARDGFTGDCARDAASIAKLLAEAQHDPLVLVAPRGLRLVERADLPPMQLVAAPVVVLTPHEITFQGRVLAPEEIEAAFREVRSRIAATSLAAPSGAGGERIYLQIDAATAWRTVVDVVDAAAAAGFRAPAFAFETPGLLTPPPRSAVDEKLDAIERGGDPSGRAAQLAEVTADVTASCAALQRLFGRLGTESGDKSSLLIEGLTGALVECRCELDMASTRSLLWRMLAVEQRVRVVAFDGATRSKTLAAPATTTWGETSKRIPSTTAGLRLVAE